MHGGYIINFNPHEARIRNFARKQASDYQKSGFLGTGRLGCPESMVDLTCPRTSFRIHVVEWGVDRSRRQDRGRCGCQDATTSGFMSASVHAMLSVRCARIHIRIASASVHYLPLLPVVCVLARYRRRRCLMHDPNSCSRRANRRRARRSSVFAARTFRLRFLVVAGAASSAR